MNIDSYGDEHCYENVGYVNNAAAINEDIDTLVRHLLDS